MLKHHIMEAEGIVVVEPTEALSEDDFKGLATSVDAYLEQHDTINGLLIHAERFPGWDAFAGFTAHMKFVRDHHQKIERVALATDSPLGALAQALVKHFVSAEVRHFAYAEYDEALGWLKSD